VVSYVVNLYCKLFARSNSERSCNIFGENVNKSLELNFLVYPVRQYRLLMFTNTGYVSKTKHNLTQIRKLVKSCIIRYVFVYAFILINNSDC